MTTSFRSRLGAVTVATVLMASAGCTTDAFDAKNGNIVAPTAVDGPAGLPAYLLGAQQDFGFANAGDEGNQEGMILISGLLADEFLSYDTFPTRIEIDRRDMDPANTTLETAFRNVQRARVAAGKAAAQYIKWAPSDGANISYLLTLSGLATIYMAENYCSGVPLSTYSADTLKYGAPQTTTQMLQLAVAQFDSALAANPGDPFPSVAKGRALLDLNQYAAAGAAVAGVATNFRQVEFHASPPQNLENGVWGFFWVRKGYSMGNLEGTNGLNFRLAGDPRVVPDSVGRAQAGTQLPANMRIVYAADKYPTKTTSVVLADGIEARLIEAEAQLLSDPTGVTTLATLNNLRATAITPAMTPLLIQATAADRVSQLFSERAFWMYATGHRLGDLRRLIRQYGRGSETVFPTGTYTRPAQVFGPDVNIPVALAETNNANFTGCLDRNP